jgi:hypothetical protein
MNCIVCGKEFGLWARLSGDSDDAICRGCEKEGETRLALLIPEATPRANLRDIWNQFGELVRRYRVLEEKAAPLRNGLAEAILEATAEIEGLNDSHVEFINELSASGAIPKLVAGTEAATAVSKINARQRIEEWKRGETPKNECKGLLLQPGEVCHWEEPARLLEQRTRREYVGGYGGISVPLGRGLRLHTGGFKGHPIDTTFLADCGMGWLHITNQRLCFTGSGGAVAIPLKKMISVNGFEDGFQVFRSGAKRPTVLQVPFPELTLQLLGFATPSPND